MAKKNGQQQEVAGRRESQGPRKEFRIGRVRSSVWENHHPEKGVWYSVTFSRSYRDGGPDGPWRNANSYGWEDLLVIAELSRMAFHWIHQQLQSQSQAAVGTQGGHEAQNDSDEEIPF